MKDKSIKQRICIVCRKKQNQDELLRFCKNKNGQISVDEPLKNKGEGRGAYVCNAEQCINKLEKTKALNRHFKMQVDAKIYEKVKIGEIKFGK